MTLCFLSLSLKLSGLESQFNEFVMKSSSLSHYMKIAVVKHFGFGILGIVLYRVCKLKHCFAQLCSFSSSRPFVFICQSYFSCFFSKRWRMCILDTGLKASLKLYMPSLYDKSTVDMYISFLNSIGDKIISHCPGYFYAEYIKTTDTWMFIFVVI